MVESIQKSENANAILSEQAAAQQSEEFESRSAGDLLEWAVDRFSPQITLACSFGLEDVVLVDLVSRLTKQPRIFCLDTGRLHQETYEVMDQVRERYHLDIEIYCPDRAAVENMVRKKGVNLFYHSVDNRHECCGVRKVEPLGRALQEVQGWITGLRRSQGVTRTGVPKVEVDAAHGGITKFNPLADWTEQQVRDYIKQNDVPYNRLHDQGFPSIGCAPCTRAVQPGEDSRAGRWWWENAESRECGLHVKT